MVFKGPDSWNERYTSQRSSNTVIRGLQNLGSLVGLVAPDENDLVKRIVAKGGQTVQCLQGDPGIMVDGKDVYGKIGKDQLPSIIAKYKAQ